MNQNHVKILSTIANGATDFNTIRKDAGVKNPQQKLAELVNGGYVTVDGQAYSLTYKGEKVVS